MKGGRATSGYSELSILDYDDLFTSNNTSSKKHKSSKEEKLYNKILSNPNISDIDKKHLKRNTKEGTKLDMDDLKAFEKNALMMNDDWSDDEKPKKKSKGNKKVIDYDDENIDDLERVIGILNKKILKTHDVKYNNDLMNKRDELREKVKEIKARPEVKRLIKELDIALKKGEITEDEYESFKYGTIKTHGSDQLALKKIQADKLKKFDDNYDRINRINQTLNIYSKKHERTPKTFNHQLYNDITYLNGMLNLDEAEALLHELDVYIPPLGLSVQEYFKNIDNYVNMKPSTNISTTKSKKSQKPGNIMKARSDLKKKGDKYEITTDMNVRKGLGPKAKKALKESVNKALNKEFKGGRINGGMIGNDDDSDYEYAPLPLVSNQQRQDRIDDVLGNLYDNEGINIIDMMDNKNLNDLSKEDVIKRNNYLKEVIDDIEPGNSVNMVKIKTWNELLPIEKSRYYNDARNLGIRPKEKYLNDAYEKAKKQLSKKNNKIKKFFNVLEGTGIKRINLDYSSDEELIKRKRGRPKKGKGYGSFKSISM